MKLDAHNHILPPADFVTGAPFGPEGGSYLIRTTIGALDPLDIGNAKRERNGGGNIRRTLNLK